MTCFSFLVTAFKAGYDEETRRLRKVFRDAKDLQQVRQEFAQYASYDPDAEWQFSDMAPQQKEHLFRVLLENLGGKSVTSFPAGPQATSTASLPTIDKSGQVGKEEARSGGTTHHIQGPHLIPNVGREVIQRRPKAKSKPGQALQALQARTEKTEKKVEQREKRRKKRKGSERSRSNSVPARKSRSRTQVRPEHDSPDGDGEEEDAHEGALPTGLDVNSEHEARLKEESERRKNLGRVFALSADDFDKEEDERAKRAQDAPQTDAGMDRAEQAFEEEKTRKAAALERASRASAENRAVVFPFGINHVSLPFCGSIETSKPAPKKAESAPGPSIFWADLAADDTSSDEEEEGEFGGSALHQAALVSSLSQVLALLRRGAKVNRCDPFRETALHMAARVGSLEICAALCAARADPTVRNKDNNSALDVANFSQQQNICHLLQDLS